MRMNNICVALGIVSVLTFGLLLTIGAYKTLCAIVAVMDESEVHPD